VTGARYSQKQRQYNMASMKTSKAPASSSPSENGSTRDAAPVAASPLPDPSPAAADASLPAKKRKASNASSASASHVSSQSRTSRCSSKPEDEEPRGSRQRAASRDSSSKEESSTRLSVPTKKRKASRPESSTGSSNARQQGTSGGDGPGLVAPRKSSQDSSSSAANAASAPAVRSLPSKKRRTSSLDSSCLLNSNNSGSGKAGAPHRGTPTGSQNSATGGGVTFSDNMIRLRKNSQEDSVSSFEFSSARKGSDATPTNNKSQSEGDTDAKLTGATGRNNNNGSNHGTASSSALAPSLVATSSSSLNALDHLDALGFAVPEPVPAPAATANSRKGSDATDNSANTFGSSGQRLLLEAIMMSSSHNPQQNSTTSSATPAGAPAAAAPAPSPAAAPPYSTTNARDRLESWGGMSDLSVPHNPLDVPIGEDGKPAAVPSSAPAAAAPVPGRISMQRERSGSLASLSEVSVTLPMMFDLAAGASTSSADEGAPLVLNSNDLQAYVAAAVASVGDQLAELAGAVESAAAMGDDLDLGFDDGGNYMPQKKSKASATTAAARNPSGKGAESETSSVASPIIGAALTSGRHGMKRPRSGSTGSGTISVDFDAVQAAVHAAAAATGSLDLNAIGGGTKQPAVEEKSSKKTKKRSTKDPPTSKSTPSKKGGSASSSKKVQAVRRKLPLSRKRSSNDEDTPASSSSSSSRKSKRSKQTKAPPKPKQPMAAPVSRKAAPPLKKRAKRNSSVPTPDKVQSSSPPQTPRVSNRKTKSDPLEQCAPDETASSTAASKAAKGPASQKWEQMFECLLQFADDRKLEETKGASDKEKEEWVWDGNVPTSYKTKDGKALGRWVNNQRSAKNKGTLKDEREERLVEAGLKWSVLTSNSWNEMFEELRVYVREQTQSGKEWDGNVPTNYQIKTRPDSRFQGEDKNLGRWVNRQRSMFQAGRLRKDRQLQLEKLGLKWSMLSTTSWDAMFETLCSYVADAKKNGEGWDGNVPANYKTNDNPPRALGRWINRQRSAFTKKKLKKEYADKLNAIGLKWSVHERGRNGLNENDDDGDDDHDDDDSMSDESECQANGAKDETENGDEVPKAEGVSVSV